MVLKFSLKRMFSPIVLRERIKNKRTEKIEKKKNFLFNKLTHCKTSQHSYWPCRLSHRLHRLPFRGSTSIFLFMSLIKEVHVDGMLGK